MEVKNKNVASLCNCEVLSLLNELKKSTVKNITTGSQLATIVYEASQYLQNLNGGQSESDVKNLLTALLDFPIQFTHQEKMSIINTIPRSTLELTLIINNYDSRVSDEEANNLLTVIANNSSPEMKNLQT